MSKHLWLGQSWAQALDAVAREFSSEPRNKRWPKSFDLQIRRHQHQSKKLRSLLRWVLPKLMGAVVPVWLYQQAEFSSRQKSIADFLQCLAPQPGPCLLSAAGKTASAWLIIYTPPSSRLAASYLGYPRASAFCLVETTASLFTLIGWIPRVYSNQGVRLQITRLQYQKAATYFDPEPSTMAGKTTYNEEVADFICEQLMEGLSLGEIMKLENKPKDMPSSRMTIYNWLDQNPAFRSTCHCQIVHPEQTVLARASHWRDLCCFRW